MTTQPTPKGAWKITFLLFLFMLVNFADKIVVGLAGVPIMTELKLEPEQFGLLGSSFFFLFSIAAIVVGFIVNRVATRWVLLALALVWALAQFPMVGHGRVHDALDLQRYPRRRRGTGVFGGGAFGLQMVS
jgi:MFS family permease